MIYSFPVPDIALKRLFVFTLEINMRKFIANDPVYRAARCSQKYIFSFKARFLL